MGLDNESSLMNPTLLKAQRWLAVRTVRRDLLLERDAGVVSFSFDDAPKSACEVGRKTLETQGCRGTWYIAGGLTDQLEQGRMCHSVNDLKDLVKSGHHIGCHTFSHRPCDGLSDTEMRSELQRNSSFFRDIGLPSSELHFSFPLGAFHLTSKRTAAQHFLSARITGGGVQVGRVDLNALRSERLYQHAMTLKRLASLVDTVASQRGWLIFYTHDVEAVPSQWGCTPQLLDTAVQMALAAGCKVLPVDQAVQYWKNK
jgi:peptidoglycan/xylan/chitin deacetylase (PgdA/CDA1 family)